MPEVGPGTRLEHRFTLRSELTRQGHLGVFLASDAITGERHEAHVLDGRASEEAKVAFSREAEVLGRVDDRAFVSVAAVGALATGELYCVVSERSSTRLSDRTGTMSIDHAAKAAAQLLRATARLHAIDWCLGWLDPEQVDETSAGGEVQLRILRLPNARPFGTEAPQFDSSASYADPRLQAGATLSVATDISCIGRIVRALVGATSDRSQPVFWELLDQLTGEQGAAVFTDADAAADAFEAIESSESTTPWPFAVPDVSGRFRTTDTEISAERESSEVIVAPAAPMPTSAGLAVETAPASGSRRWIPIVGAVAALVIGAAVIAMPKADDAQEAAAPVANAATAATAEGEVAVAAGATRQPSSADTSIDPIRDVATLNRTQLDQVLDYGPRHELLTRVSTRSDLLSRVDLRWHRWLDLTQAAQSPTPCATFREAVAELKTPPQTEAEEAAAAAVEIPTPSTVLGAGVAPDEDCNGLSEAFAELVPAVEPETPEARPEVVARTRRSSKRSRGSSKSAAPAAPAPEAQPPQPAPPKSTKSVEPKRQPSVATKLDDLKAAVE